MSSGGLTRGKSLSDTTQRHREQHFQGKLRLKLSQASLSLTSSLIKYKQKLFLEMLGVGDKCWIIIFF